MANPLLDDDRAYDSQAANPVGTSQWQRNLPADTRWQAPPEPFNLYKWVKDTQPQYTAGNLLKALGAGALAGPEMMRRALRGKYDPDSSVDREAMADFAGVSGGSAFGGRAAPILRSWIGPNAKFADQRMLDLAVKMDARGDLPRTIYGKTNWWKNPQKEWKSEVSDHEALLKTQPYQFGVLQSGLVTQGGGYWVKPGLAGLSGNTLPDVLQHKELYRNYPDLYDVKMGTNADVGGNWQPRTGTINMSPEAISSRKMLPLLGHEAGHAVQSLEKWQSGSSPVNHLPVDYYNVANQAAISQEVFTNIAKAKGMIKEDERNLISAAKAQAAGFLNEKHPHYTEFAKFIANNSVEGKALIEAGQNLNKRENMDRIARKDYMSVTGEEDMRLIEKRWNMTPKERSNIMPWEQYDAGPKLQIRSDILPWMGGKP